MTTLQPTTCVQCGQPKDGWYQKAIFVYLVIVDAGEMNSEVYCHKIHLYLSSPWCPSMFCYPGMIQMGAIANIDLVAQHILDVEALLASSHSHET
jgi:hypothetical protein